MEITWRFMISIWRCFSAFLSLMSITLHNNSIVCKVNFLVTIISKFCFRCVNYFCFSIQLISYGVKKKIVKLINKRWRVSIDGKVCNNGPMTAYKVLLSYSYNNTIQNYFERLRWISKIVILLIKSFATTCSWKTI